MRFVNPCVVILYLVLVVSGKSATQADISTTVIPEDTTDQTTESEPLKTAETELSTSNADADTNGESNVNGKTGDNDDAIDRDLALEEMLLIGSLFSGDGDDTLDENSGTDSKKNKGKLDIATDSTNPFDSIVTIASDGIRRQGDVNPLFNQNKMNSEIQYDDTKTDGRSNLPYSESSQTFNRDNIQDEGVELQLTNGGYNKPTFGKDERPSSNDRLASISDSSQQAEKMLDVPVRSSSRQQQGRQILPQATYPIPPQFPFTPFRPMLPTTLDSSGRNILPINPFMPDPRGMVTPPTRNTDYRTAGFQAQYPNPDAGVFSNFGQDTNNAALFHTSQRNPFQDTSLLFQNAPQVQSQPILFDPSGNIPPQFQQDPLSAFTNFDNVDDNSRSNYAAFFGEPAGNNPQFQVPPNFFGPNLNRVHAFNSPPVSFMPRFPNSQERLPDQYTRYLPAKDSQNQQTVNDQQPESEASQEEKTTSIDSQEGSNTGTNNDDLPFGTRLQDKDDTDVYIKYPTNEAGYAVEENLPPRNNSDDAKINGKQAETEQRNFPNIDPYRNTLNLLQSSQRINSSFGLPPPPPIFRDTPINFGYRSPENPIMIQYPDRNRDLPSFIRPDFNPFNALTSFPENNYGNLRGNTPRQGNQEIVETPSCAKQNNVSFCFEDDEYPSGLIMHSILNSNAFLSDQLSGSNQLLNSDSLVEKNSSVPEQTTENYACPVDIKYGLPLRAKNVAGVWRVMVNIKGTYWQSVRLEVCKPLGEPCKYTDSKLKTSCVQKYSVQRFMVWSQRGIFMDLFKMPVACSCQILDMDLP